MGQTAILPPEYLSLSFLTSLFPFLLHFEFVVFPESPRDSQLSRRRFAASVHHRRRPTFNFDPSHQHPSPPCKRPALSSAKDPLLTLSLDYSAQTTNMSAEQEGTAPAAEHLNIKVTDNNNEVFFKIKRSTQLKKLMDAFCERQGKQPTTVRFLFDGTRVRPEDTPETVRT